MPVNSTHPSYDANAEAWQRIRDVLAGDSAIKRAGQKYVPRLDSQTDEEYRAYVERGFFYNATARTVSGYIGMIFRRDPVLQLPGTFTEGHKGREGNEENPSPEHSPLRGPRESSPIRRAMEEFVRDVDLVGTTLDGYSKNIVHEVVSLGRAGTLIDWESEPENRAYISMYAAESILNWRQVRINGAMELSLVVLSETAPGEPKEDDPFVIEDVPQIRVLKLGKDPTEGSKVSEGKKGLIYQVEIWQELASDAGKKEWKLVATMTPLRLGKPLSSIPFVFHGPTHCRPDVEKSPIEDIVAANLDHYRLNTDYKHGMHFTALPTAFVAGFDKNAQLRIGSTTAWVTETLGATAEFLEFKGDGLATFERALDRCERLLAVLGSRLLESQKRVSESAEALSLRQAGESSVLASISGSVTASMNEVLRWVYWWHSTEQTPEDVSSEQIKYELSADFETGLMDAEDIQALIAAWQMGAISRDTLLHNFRQGEILPPGRTNEQEMELVRKEPAPRIGERATP
jgi:hypothetical protein